jgi:pyroglutamyl-peptidase
MVTVLVIGFGPFPGAPDNPSATLAARLARIRRPAFAHHRVVTHVFPTSYAAVARALSALIARHRPEIVVMFGLAARTPYIRVELQAANRVSVLHPDIDNRVSTAREIRPGGPQILRTRAPTARLVAAARTAGVDVRASRDAGSYVCNYAYWLALEAANAPRGPNVVVFIHVPKLRTARRRKGRPRLPTLEMLVRAAQSVVTAAVADQRRR